MTAVNEAKTWFAQAASDLRTATALLGAPPPVDKADVGCHVAAMCAQTIEKSIKGTPAGAPEFSDSEKLAQWLKLSERIHSTLHKLVITVERSELR